MSARSAYEYKALSIYLILLFTPSSSSSYTTSPSWEYSAEKSSPIIVKTAVVNGLFGSVINAILLFHWTMIIKPPLHKRNARFSVRTLIQGVALISKEQENVL